MSDRFEVTDSIKEIMDSVDELSHNYDKRVAAMHVDYQNNMQEVLDFSRKEKYECYLQLTKKELIIEKLEQQLREAKYSYHTLNVEYKINKEALIEAREELSQLKAALDSSKELLSQTTNIMQNIASTTETELLSDHTEVISEEIDTNSDELEPIESKRQRFGETRKFISRIFALNFSKPIMLHTNKKEPSISRIDESSENDEYLS